MGTMPSERGRQENGFLVLRRIVLTLVTLHVQEDLRGFDKERLNTSFQIDPRQCTLELANVMNCDHSTIVRHLHSMDKVKKSDVWVLHVLSQNHKNQRVALLARHRLAREQNRPFLSCIVTGDEKLCLYANIKKKGMIEPES